MHDESQLSGHANTDFGIGGKITNVPAVAAISILIPCHRLGAPSTTMVTSSKVTATASDLTTIASDPEQVTKRVGPVAESLDEWARS